LGTTSHWESEPEDENELECVVEWEPIHGADGTLKNGQEREDNPICKPLSVIRLAHAEQGLQGVVTRNDESSKIDKQLTSDIEENEKEIGGDQSEDGIGLWDRGLLFQIVQGRVLRKLATNPRQ